MSLFHKNTPAKIPRMPNPRIFYARRITHDPYIDWEVLVTLFFLLTIMVVGVGGWVYYTTAEDLGRTNTVLAPNKLNFSEQILNETIRRFQKKAADKTAMLKSGYIGAGDPSI